MCASLNESCSSERFAPPARAEHAERAETDGEERKSGGERGCCRLYLAIAGDIDTDIHGCRWRKILASRPFEHHAIKAAIKMVGLFRVPIKSANI
jgi:hypothetical protein